jgi:hypothetical protein
VPQFETSVATFAHALPQSDSGAAQRLVHTPASQYCAGVQALPHPPQLDGSLRVSRHDPPQSVSGAEHVAVQLPAEHASVGAHACEQPPQFNRSTLRSMHTPPQAAVPGPQIGMMSAVRSDEGPRSDASGPASKTIGVTATSTHVPALPHVWPRSSQNCATVHGTSRLKHPTAGFAHAIARKIGRRVPA